MVGPESRMARVMAESGGIGIVHRFLPIEKQVAEVREHLEKAQNPVFFFDNDPDGLCSFLLLQRYIGRGRGVVIKSFPQMGLIR